MGDLDHDGVIESDTAVSTTDITNATLNEMWQGIGQFTEEAHYYAECSGKGQCDRTTGECGCFEGFTGNACQRAECPSRCSGHGVCRTLREIAANKLNKRIVRNEMGVRFYEGVEASFEYNLWDADKAQACICDAGYTGFDCSLRDCLRNDDPLTSTARWHGSETPEWATMTFNLPGSPNVVKFGLKSWDGRTYNTYAKLNSGVDSPGQINADGNMPGIDTTAGKIMLALRNMPGGHLKRATVTSEDPLNAGSFCPAPGACNYIVELVGRPGKQDLLEVSLMDEPPTPVTVAFVQSGGRDVDGNREEITCSGRGLCDHATGLCDCFAGYFGASCESQNALASGTGDGGVPASTTA